jgi:hypothetical protein
LKNLHDQVEEHQWTQSQRIAKALRQEGEWRLVINGEKAEEVTHIRTDMQEFVNKQLPGWIQEEIASGLSNFPPAPSVLTREQI